MDADSKADRFRPEAIARNARPHDKKEIAVENAIGAPFGITFTQLGCPEKRPAKTKRAKSPMEVPMATNQRYKILSTEEGCK